MSWESAVTEKSSYRFENCEVCRAEVGLDAGIPEDEMVETGYALLLGGGKLSITNEQEGNWSTGLTFAGNKSDSTPPTVRGYILCGDCAEAVHGHSTESQNYTGVLPSSLTKSIDEVDLPISRTALIAIVLAVLLILLIISI